MEKIHFVNKNNLRWGRQKAGLDFSQAYKKAGWSPKTEKIEKWENGDAFPTVNELRKLGEVYRRPWTLFIIQEDAKNLGFKFLEFRKIFGKEQSNLSPHLFEFLNELKNKQDFLIEFSSALDLKRNRLVGLCKDMDDRQAVAEKIISHAEIDMNVFWRKKTRRDGFNYLVECLERKNIFVSSTSSNHNKAIPVEQMRGVLLNSSTAPIVGINAKDKSYGARIFTVFHELTHLFRGDSFDGDVEITKINFRNRASAGNDKESFCNGVAALILVPDDQLKKASGPIGKETVERECIRLKVNHQTLLYRMQDVKLLDRREANELLERIKEDEIEPPVKKDKENSGGPDGGYLKMLQNGKALVHAVNTLYSQGEITFTQALNVLDIKAKTYRKFAEKI